MRPRQQPKLTEEWNRSWLLLPSWTCFNNSHQLQSKNTAESKIMDTTEPDACTGPPQLGRNPPKELRTSQVCPISGLSQTPAYLEHRSNGLGTSVVGASPLSRAEGCKHAPEFEAEDLESSMTGAVTVWDVSMQLALSFLA